MSDNIETILRGIWNKICEIANNISPSILFNVNGEDCSGAVITAEATSTVQTVPHPDFIQKVKLCSTGLDPEVVCLSNDGGTTSVTGWEVFDTNTNPPTSTLYIGGVVVTGYQVVPCSKAQKDREIYVVCVDGKKWTKVITFEDDLPVSFLWLDDTDTPQPTPDALLIDNVNCNQCVKVPLGTIATWG